MKHARKMSKQWKIVIIVLAVLTGVSAIFLVYIYFPIITGFIDRGIDYLFKPSGETQKQNAVEEENAEDIGLEDPKGVDQEKETEEDPEEVSEEEQEQELESIKTGEESKEEEQIVPESIAPTIKLRIYEGPLYSKSDDVCYYRVIAEVTGDPSPKVTFNKDDSLGLLGPGKAQVNITRNSQFFTLNATVENSKGKSSDSIALSWNCNRAPDISGISLETDTMYVNEDYNIQVEVVDLDGDQLIYLWSASGGDFDDGKVNPTEWDAPGKPGDCTISVSVTDGVGNTSESSIKVYVGEKVQDPESVNLNLPRKENEGGYIEYEGNTNTGGNLYAGDSGDNKPCSGFISFDITGISSKTVESASLSLSGASIFGDPLGFLDTFWINSLNWGAEPITQGDFLLTGVAIANYDSQNITCNISKLREELQKAINENRSRFQIRIHFGGAFTDNDDEKDGWSYSQSNVKLNVTVSP